jgi:cytochrome b
MASVRVYDLPTRVFHWLFAGLFITAFSIANLVDDESLRFPLHMLAGLGLVFVVLLRLLWSAVGTHHARLSDLALAPRQLLGYLKGVLSGGGRLWAGHNPASSWAAVAMVLLALSLGVTGLMMATGNESVEAVHELLANGFLAVVLLHLAGLAIHALRHRDRLPAAMVTGGKQGLPADEAPVAARSVAAVAMLAFAGLFGTYLWQHYDAQARTLGLAGYTLQLGEGEEHEGRGGDMLATHGGRDGRREDEDEHD